MGDDRLQGPETAGVLAATRDAGRRQSIVDVFILALLALAACVALLSLWDTVHATYHHAARDLVGTVALVALLGAGWLLNRRGRTDLATWLCLLGLLVATTFFFDAEVLDRVLVVYAVPVVGAAFLLTPRTSFLFAGLAALDYIAVWTVHRRPADFNYIALFALAAVALLSYLVASAWQQAGEVQEEYRRELERDVAEREQAQAELQARECELEAVAQRLRAGMLQMVDAMVAAVELHDPGTTGHQRRVAQLSAAIGHELGLGPEAMDTLRMAAVLHDVGMASVPVLIVTKPGELSAVEYDLVKEHPELARPVLEHLEFGGPLADIVSEHHERLDGSGYPRGLKGEAIRREARIIAVADTVEAMMSGRPHRPPHTTDEALRQLQDGAGTLYDEQAVAACVRVFGRGFAFEA